MKRLLLLILFAVVLFGCNSFNNLTYKVEVIPPPPPSPIVNETVQNKSVVVLCPAFIFPELPSKPALPLDELEKIRPDDHRGLDAIQQKQIEDLRKYIYESHKLLRDSYQKYLDECQAKQRKSAG